MSWYRTGTVTVANASAAVTGAGTDFVANAQIGHAFLGPDGRVYEIAQVVSATQVVLSGAYMGGSGGGQGYAVMPTSSFARDLALGAAELLNSFAAVRDGIGAGLFPDGTLAAPGLRFAADPDTGIRRNADNSLSLVSGGVDRLFAGANGITVPASVDIGTGRFFASNVADTFSLTGVLHAHFGMTVKSTIFGPDPGIVLSGFGGMACATGGAERLRIDNVGNLLVGTTSGSCHTLQRNIAADAANAVLSVNGFYSGAPSAAAVFYSVGGQTLGNGANAAVKINRDRVTGRSVNAGGTVNASGADYAEYMKKANGCGTIAPGDVCGVDMDGRLTKTWAAAQSFVVKSTDPSYVGGDTWGQSVGPRPEGPGEEPAAPIVPPAEPASEDAEAAWQAEVASYPARLAAYQSAHAAWTTAQAGYDAALPAWEAALEAERQKVDRIAFSGQVPVNVSGTFGVGDYLIAAASGAGIKAVAVPEADITFDQYRRRLGKVWAVREGRAWVDVQHG